MSDEKHIPIDLEELVRRAASHPVAGPVIQVIRRDLALEQLSAENEQLRQRLAELEPAADETADETADEAPVTA